MASEDESDVLIVSQPGTTHEWILDSASCFHICSMREMFNEESLRPMNETVYLAIARSMQSLRYEMVILEIHNRTYCTLLRVRYILSLKNNLTSVRLLEL